MSNNQIILKMRLFNSIVVAVLFFSILLIPSEDAPISTFFAYALWSAGALFIINIIFRHKEEE